MQRREMCILGHGFSVTNLQVAGTHGHNMKTVEVHVANGSELGLSYTQSCRWGQFVCNYRSCYQRWSSHSHDCCHRNFLKKDVWNWSRRESGRCCTDTVRWSKAIEMFCSTEGVHVYIPVWWNQRHSKRWKSGPLEGLHTTDHWVFPTYGCAFDKLVPWFSHLAACRKLHASSFRQGVPVGTLASIVKLSIVSWRLLQKQELYQKLDQWVPKD